MYYDLFFTSGFHQPLDLCEGRQAKLGRTKQQSVGHLKLQHL
jgi:hypothetical protein